jgi:oligoribonuclease
MEKNPADGNYYVWFDTEYSDLDLEKASLLQVAVLITDTALKRVLPPEEDVRLTIQLPAGQSLSPWVEEHLPDLANACRSPQAVDLVQADERLAAYVDKVAGRPKEREDQRPILAGNSIHADWWMSRRFLPHFLRRLHYRHLDVTAFKLEWQLIQPRQEFEKENPEMIKRYFPEANIAAEGRHDAYYDLQASIAELAFYRQKFFVTNRS